MVKKLTKHGNSLDLLHIDSDTPLKITTDGRRLVVAPAKPSARRQKFEE